MALSTAKRACMPARAGMAHKARHMHLGEAHRRKLHGAHDRECQLYTV